MNSFYHLSAVGEPITRYVSRMKDSAIHFLARGLSSDVVLRLCAHSTSRNPAPVAAPQQARVVYAGLLSQSLHPYNRRFSDRRIIFHSGKPSSAFVVPELPSLTHMRALSELQL